jgi:hypothetical protein
MYISSSPVGYNTSGIIKNAGRIVYREPQAQNPHTHPERIPRSIGLAAALALLLAFGSEVLLWPHWPARSMLDWVLLAPGYLALSITLLAAAARFRLRDLFGLMALAGLYGILAGLLLHPASALADAPRTWFTRVMGAHSLIGLLMLTLLLVLRRPLSRWRALALAVIALPVGIAWGAWGRWSGDVYSGGAAAGETPLALLLAAAAGLAVLTGLMLLGLRRWQPAPVAPSRRALALALLGLLALLIVRVLQGSLDGLSLLILGTFAVFSMGVLYNQERRTGRTLLDGLQAAPAAGWAGLLAAVLALGVGAALGYGLQRGQGANDPVFVITTLFTAYGIGWLPAVAAVLAARGISRQARLGRL